MAVQPKQYDLILSRRADFSLRLGFKSELIIKTSQVNISNNLITVEAHGLENNDPVIYYAKNAAALEPLVNETTYYVRDKTDNTFKLATEIGGAVIVLTSQGNSAQVLTARNNLNGCLVDAEVWDVNRTLQAAAFNVAYTSPTTGIVDLSLTDEQTANLTADNYKWDVLLQNGAGLKEYYVRGNINVSESYSTT